MKPLARYGGVAAAVVGLAAAFFLLPDVRKLV
jgi:hypothetical protein